MITSSLNALMEAIKAVASQLEATLSPDEMDSPIGGFLKAIKDAFAQLETSDEPDEANEPEEEEEPATEESDVEEPEGESLDTLVGGLILPPYVKAIMNAITYGISVFARALGFVGMGLMAISRVMTYANSDEACKDTAFDKLRKA